jgi:hypothetical protein
LSEDFQSQEYALLVGMAQNGVFDGLPGKMMKSRPSFLLQNEVVSIRGNDTGNPAPAALFGELTVGDFNSHASLA